MDLPVAIFLIFIYVYEYLHAHMCTVCVPSTQRGLKRVLGPLKLEFHMVLSHHVVAGNLTSARAP